MNVFFMKQFLRNPRHVGAICPSSKKLADTITSEVGLSEAAVVAELGPGTGVFTEMIFSKKKEETSFFVVELNSEMCELLEQRFEDIKIFNRSATELAGMLEELSKSRLDLVVSGLPWASFPDKLQDDILEAVTANLKAGGYFTTFAYLQGMLLPAAQKFKRKLSERFSEVTTSPVVWGNVPPAFVYRCKL